MIFSPLLLLAAAVPGGEALSVGSAVGTGAALVWLLAKTLPDRERTLREVARAHREGQRELAQAVNEFKDSMVRQLGDGNQQMIDRLTAVAYPRPREQRPQED